MVETTIVKTVQLNILPLTSKKEQMLSRLEEQYLNASDHLFETLGYWEVFDLPLTRFNLQKMEYKHIKNEFGLNSQLIVDVIKDAFTSWKSGGRDGIDRASIPFNIPRSGSFRETKRSNPVISIATLDGRIGLPISQDGAFDRFNQFLKDGWNTTMFRAKRDEDGWQLLVSISKSFDIKGDYDAIIGVDVGSRTLATISVLDRKGKILKQLYLGKDIWEKERDICIRRSKLQSLSKRWKIKRKPKVNLKN